jgi:hypothetical protein
MLRERRQRVKRKVPADCPLVCQNRDEPWPPTGPPDGSKSATDGPVQMQIECTPSWSIAANDRLGLNFLVLGRAGKVRYRRTAVTGHTGRDEPFPPSQPFARSRREGQLRIILKPRMPLAIRPDLDSILDISSPSAP